MKRASLANNATTTLAAAITSTGATSFTVTSAAAFPAITGTQYFYCTLLDAALIPEIVKVTGVSGTTFTCVRGQDGSTAQTFAVGASVKLNLTAAVIAELVSSDTSLNTSIGTNASPIVTGGFNTSFGYSAGQSLTTGVANTVIGANALKAAVNSFGSTAAGVFAGNAQTTGTANTFLGYYASSRSLTSNYVTAIGGNAGDNQFDLSGCVALGYGAMNGSLAVTIPATQCVASSSYTVATVGTTDFTLGGGVNTPLTTFICNGPLTGTGTVYPNPKNSIAIGTSAAARLSGNYNTVIGDGALNVVSGVNQCSYTIVLGASAGSPYSLYGQHSTFIGAGSGAANIASNYSTLIGRYAGQFGYGFVNCTGIGQNVLWSIDVTYINATSTVAGKWYNIVSIGTTDFTLIGGVNIVGTTFQATGVGAGTGQVVRVQDNCVAIGDSALTSCQASYSVAIGTQAGYNASGNGNISMGLNAGSGVSGNYNVSLGYNAGANLSGDSNTFVGNSTGGSVALTGTNNTLLGNSAVASAAGVSNEITLGNSSVATLRCNVTSITSLSDVRDKTDVAPLSYGLDFVMKLKPVTFTWNMRDGGKVGVKDSGFIAQDLMATEDEAGAADYLQLTYRSNPDKLEATYGHLLPVLVKALQDLKNEFDAYKASHP